MIKTSIQVGTPPSSDVKEIISTVLHAKSVVVICGAGISVAAGIPPFRGTGGIYNKSVGGLKTEEIFHIRSLQHGDTRETFCKFMAEMATTAAVAIPTHFHKLLASLNYRRTLRRIYTQNIDGLELKAGLSNCSAYGIHDQKAICVPLHGHLHQMRCQSCSSTFSLDAFYGTLTAGELPICVVCQMNGARRAHLQLRDRKTVSFLRPDIILYGEDHPLAEEIADLQKMDVSSVDLLLVVGTSMKVDGIQAIIRTFTRSLRRQRGMMQAIYLNTELSSPQKWAEAFDFWVWGDCQLFAIMVEDELEKEMVDGRQTLEPSLETGHKAEESSQSGGTFWQRIAVADRRLDLRPLCRYY